MPRALADAGLTPREGEVFWSVVDRLRNREIAERLHVSERTVESHVAALLRKLGGADRTSLISLGENLRARLGADDLPRILSTFVGREAEMDALSSLVSAHRLVTMTGPAGVGKTRLAFEVARAADDLPAPILVDLGPIATGRELDRAFASSLGLLEEDRDLRGALRAALRDDRHWLLVDNCEHVASDVALLLGDLLSAASGLRVLATSRSPLRLAGEVIYEVPPLSLPDDEDPSTVLQSPAARLLVDRASTAAPGFEVTADNADAIALLCQRLDGLPLALELAAARIRTFSPRELVAHLDARFQLLDDVPLGGPVRHQTLEAALRWSYELLDDDERLAFERCSVFAGEFDYDTAAAVVVHPPLAPDGFARSFPRLLDRSLLSRRRLKDQTTAYRMLETFREFARERLEAGGGGDEARRRHASHHLDKAVALVRDFVRGGPSPAPWFAAHWTDIRGAMRWTLDRGDVEAAWRLLADIGRRWDSLGIRGDLFDWLEELLAEPWPAGDLGLDARLATAYLSLYGDVDRALQVAEEALELVAPDDAARRTTAEVAVGLSLNYVGDRDRARRHLQSALDQARRLGDRWCEALALQGLGHAAQDVPTMIAHLELAGAVYGDLNDEVLRANCLTMMASQALEMGGQSERIDAWLDEAHGIAVRNGETHERLHAELHRARLGRRRGSYEESAAAFQELLPSLRRIGDHRCAARCLAELGLIALQREDPAAAREYLLAGVAAADRVKDPLVFALNMRLLAQAEFTAGRPTQAARLLGAAQSAADRLDPTRRGGLPADEAIRERITEAIGVDGFESAFDQGRQDGTSSREPAAP